MKDYLVISSTPWCDQSHMGTQHHLALELARRGRVLFLELPASPLSGLTGLRPGAFRRALARWRQGVRHLQGGRLLISAPPPVLPWRYHRLTGAANSRLLARHLHRVLARLGMERPTVVTFQADSAALVRAVPAKARAYWCTDDWSAAERWWQTGGVVRAREMELAAEVDLVAAVSRRLVTRFVTAGHRTLLLRNGVDLVRFHPERAGPVPGQLAALPRPRVGFVGIMNRYNFDASLVTGLARQRPGWSVVIVGRPEGPGVDLSPLNGLPNVHTLGFQPPEAVPAHILGLDVGLIPWPHNPWVESAFSLKFFEYLALGIPVVARSTAEYACWSDPPHRIWLAEGVEGFVAAVEEALAVDSPELAAQRHALAARHGWEAQTAALLKALEG